MDYDVVVDSTIGTKTTSIEQPILTLNIASMHPLLANSIQSTNQILFIFIY